LVTTLEEVEAALPNGLHDAYLRTLSIDYANAELVLVLDGVVSTPESGNEYRPLEVRVVGLLFAVVDVPPSVFDFSGRGLRIDAGPGQPSTAEVELPKLPADCFLHWLFVAKLNAFIRIAGRDASYRWLA
jgi:hypothetical protein